MREVIVNIIVALLGFGIGAIAMWKALALAMYKKWYCGTLNIAEDPVDKQWYLSLALDKNPSIMANERMALVSINHINTGIENMSPLQSSSQNNQTL